MSTVRLIVDEASIARSGTQIVGKIWLELESLQFPGPDWYDLVLPVLESWVRNLALITSGERKRVHIHFMEGPMNIRVQRTANRSLCLTAIDNEQIVAKAETTDRDLLPSIRHAAQVALKRCREIGFWSEDADELEKQLEAIRSSRATHTTGRE
jgi:hypothetical protein